MGENEEANQKKSKLCTCGSRPLTHQNQSRSKVIKGMFKGKWKNG